MRLGPGTSPRDLARMRAMTAAPGVASAAFLVLLALALAVLTIAILTGAHSWPFPRCCATAHPQSLPHPTHLEQRPPLGGQLVRATTGTSRRSWRPKVAMYTAGLRPA